MAKITRYNGNVLPFASTAQTGERLIFGNAVATGDTLDQNIVPEWLRGWGQVGANDFPPLEWFNSSMYTSTLLASYLYQVGVPEWNGTQEYHLNSIVNFGGVLYVCKTNNHTSVTDPASDTVNWSVDYVRSTGNQTIAGVKTFSSSPIVPTPTAGTHAVNKEYVDSGVGASFVANDTRVKTALSASGDAPIYACRAWVNFNGTGTVAIRASGNVSSITDNGTGNYRVNFTTAMPDANYAPITGTSGDASPGDDREASAWMTSTTSCTVIIGDSANTNVFSDVTGVFLSIFR